MKIITTSKEFDKYEIYELTKSPDVQKMRNVAGQELEVVDFIEYENTDSNGEIKKIVVLKTAEGETFGTNSASFVKEFEDVISMAEVPFNLGVISGKSKAGRSYLTCAWRRH